MRLTLDVEAQQSFEFLSDQVQGPRKAFSTLSDVLIEEVDLIRSEAATRHEEVAEKLSAQAKGAEGGADRPDAAAVGGAGGVRRTRRRRRRSRSGSRRCTMTWRRWRRRWRRAARASTCCSSR